MKKYVFVFLVLLFIAGCTQKLKPVEQIPATSSEEGPSVTAPVITKATADVTFKTEDNVKIAGTYYKGSNDKAIILLHELNRDKSLWKGFAGKLQANGYNILAIDLRGHGKSDLKWRDFTEDDFRSMEFDVKAAKDFLSERGFTKFAVIGASLGANLALNYAATDPEVQTVVMLSPGYNYKGISIEDTIKMYKNPILVAAAKKDSYAAGTSRAIQEQAYLVQLQLYDNAQHGTDLFGLTNLDETIIEWLGRYLK